MWLQCFKRILRLILNLSLLLFFSMTCNYSCYSQCLAGKPIINMCSLVERWRPNVTMYATNSLGSISRYSSDSKRDQHIECGLRFSLLGMGSDVRA